MYYHDMQNLKKNWDSYNADPPSELTINKLEQFIDNVPGYYRIAPSVIGGTSATYKHNGVKYFVEFYNTGTIGVLFSDGKEMETFIFTSLYDAIKLFKERLLNGN